jgi:hypothetical protein
MSILISITELTNRQGTNNPPVPKLYGVPFINQVINNGTSATIILNGKRNNEERIISETSTEILALTNVGYKDFILEVTLTSGVIIGLKASQIVEAEADNSGNTIIRFRDYEKQEDTPYTITETLSEILDLCPITPKVYFANLAISGTDAPVATVIQNDLGGEVVWSRFASGWYKATLIGAFPLGRVRFIPSEPTVKLGGGAGWAQGQPFYFEEDSINLLTYTLISQGVGNNVTELNEDASVASMPFSLEIF